MYDGYAFEVIVQKDGHYPKDHDYPPRARFGRAGRLLAPVLRADARSHAVDRPGAPGDRPLFSTATGPWGEPVKLTEKLPKGEAYLETEAPRGQMGFYIVSTGSGAIPWRARARSSSFCNLSVTHELCRGCLIADVPAIVGSLDIVMGEIDR